MKLYVCGIVAATTLLTPTLLRAQEAALPSEELVQEQVLTFKEKKRLSRDNALLIQKEEANTRIRKKAVEKAEERAQKEKERQEERAQKASRFQKAAQDEEQKKVEEQKKDKIEEGQNLSRFEQRAQERAAKRALKEEEKLMRKNRRKR